MKSTKWQMRPTKVAGSPMLAAAVAAALLIAACEQPGPLVAPALDLPLAPAPDPPLAPAPDPPLAPAPDPPLAPVPGPPPTDGVSGSDVTITMEPKPVTMVVGGDVQLKVIVRRGGSDITGQAFVWFSSQDEDIAKVDQTGVATGVSVGKTKLIALTMGDGWPVRIPFPEDTISVTVVNPGS